MICTKCHGRIDGTIKFLLNSAHIRFPGQYALQVCAFRSMPLQVYMYMCNMSLP